MLEKYHIVKEKGEEVLYLFLNNSYEFSLDISNSDLKEKAYNYLASHNINFKGNQVVFVINGIPSRKIKLHSKLYPNDLKIFLKDNDALTMKELLLSLLFSNISLNLPLEALKAIVVLYRSEVISKLDNNNLDINKINLLYKNYNYYKLKFKETYYYYLNIFLRAIDETNSEYLVYNDKPINCYIHLVSNGYTDVISNVPYLEKKESFWDLSYPNYLQVTNYSIRKFKEIFNIKEDKVSIKINLISKSNRIKELIINNKVISAKTVAALLNLPSTDITIIIKKDYLTFVTRGIGSGLGLSIVGALNLAELDCNYKQILNYYFKDVSLIIKEKKR